MPTTGKTPEDGNEKENIKIGKVSGHPKLKRWMGVGKVLRNQILMENRLMVICPIVKTDAKHRPARALHN